MKLSITRMCRVVAISLFASVIWQGAALAAVMPAIEPLGQIKEGLRHPTILDIDADGDLYVVDSRKRAVVKIDKYGAIVAEFADPGYRGRGLAVSADGSRIYVSKETSVAVLDGATGAVVGALGKGEGEFEVAGEIDLDAAGYVFVSDFGTKFVRVYNAAGEFQYQFGGQGFAAGQLYNVSAMSVAPGAGEVYVADPATLKPYSYPEIQVFDLAGQYRRVLPAATGFGAPGVIHFGGMAFDAAGRGYFLDKFNSRIRIIGLPTTPLGAYGTAGYDPGQINFPSDLAFDPVTSRLFVVCDDGRIEIFGIDGGTNPVSANEPPGLPEPVSPVADGEVAEASPRLEFKNAVDPDGDVLTYDARLYLEGAQIAEYTAQPETEALSYIITSEALAENVRYEWQVRAFDGKDASEWTALESFYVNAVEEPPVAPALVEPLAGDVLDGSGALVWGESVDPDPFDTVSYVVEISQDPSFASVLASGSVAGLSVTLAEMSEYTALVDGQEYFWRVLAEDNHALLSEPGESGSFVYDTTILTVKANMPGARVYLGGNLGYAGRLVGEAPVELRDVQPGVTSVVVERAGFEPFTAPVTIAYRENVEVYASMVPAVAPADLRARPLPIGGQVLALGMSLAPLLVDFDNNGLIDLLYAQESGELQLAPGMVVTDPLTLEEEFTFDVPQSVGLSRVVAGLSPFVVDWDNDGNKDLVAGGSDGTVTLFRNTGTETTPAFGAGKPLYANGEVLSVPGPAVPAVFDIDGDGDKDLLVGSGSGEVLLFLNGGEDANPALASAGNIFFASAQIGLPPGEVAPFFVDWDGDGQRELLAATEEHLYVCERSSGNRFVTQSVLAVTDALVSPTTGKAGSGATNGNGAFSLGSGLRVFALDFDGKSGKDIIAANAAGEIRLVESYGQEMVPMYKAALLDKISQINGLVSESAPELAADVAAIEASVTAGDYRTAERLTRTLAGKVPVGTDLALAVTELLDVLP